MNWGGDCLDVSRVCLQACEFSFFQINVLPKSEEKAGRR